MALGWKNWKKYTMYNIYLRKPTHEITEFHRVFDRTRLFHDSVSSALNVGRCVTDRQADERRQKGETNRPLSKWSLCVSMLMRGDMNNNNHEWLFQGRPSILKMRDRSSPLFFWGKTKLDCVLKTPSMVEVSITKQNLCLSLHSTKMKMIILIVIIKQHLHGGGGGWGTGGQKVTGICSVLHMAADHEQLSHGGKHVYLQEQ